LDTRNPDLALLAINLHLVAEKILRDRHIEIARSEIQSLVARLFPDLAVVEIETILLAKISLAA
jgi:hypothetical protein